MAPGDVVTLKAQPIVSAQLLREAGFQVTVLAMDWQTVVTLRASQKPPKEGGWNMFFTNWVGADILNPVVHVTLNGKGKSGGWFGWPDDPKMEALRDAFVRAESPDEQEKNRSRNSATQLRTGHLHPAWTVQGPKRLAERVDRRSGRRGNAGVLEHRQGRLSDRGDR